MLLAISRGGDGVLLDAAAAFFRVKGGRMAAAASRVRIAVITTVVLVAAGPSRAQYTYDPAGADEQRPGIRYFGSAKDDRGSLLPGVSVMIDSAQAAYVFVTDEQGRFHGNLPLGLGPDKVAPRCFKVGFELVRVNKRPGPQGPKPTVQVDCVLRTSAPH